MESLPRNSRELEEILTTWDNERTLSPSTFVALSSLSRHTLAGAEKECLRKGDLWQDEVSSVEVNGLLLLNKSV